MRSGAPDRRAGPSLFFRIIDFLFGGDGFCKRNLFKCAAAFQDNLFSQPAKAHVHSFAKLGHFVQ